jgi:hypothetical protein
MKIYLPLCLWLLSLALTASAEPNIVIIYSDDHGYTDLGLFGSTATWTRRTWMLWPKAAR